MCVCLHVCPPLRLLITSGMIWTPFDWSSKFYGFYMAAEVDIDGVNVYTRRGNYPDKSKLVLYKPLLHCNNHLNSCS